MDPIVWSRTIVEHLERSGVVGCLLPRGAQDAGDRYQPHRLFVDYVWVGDRSAATVVEFKVDSAEGRDAVALERDGWAVSTRVDREGWGEQWEMVRITAPAGPLVERSEEFHAPGRFNVRLTIRDQQPQDGHVRRRIELENMRETGGILHAVRIVQSDLPQLERVRPYGIDEDIYYRAGGLVATMNPERHELTFSPFALLPEPRRLPVAGPSLHDAVAAGLLQPAVAALLEERGFRSLWQFQADSIAEIRRWLNGAPRGEAILLTGATAAGKTEAFFLPLLESLIPDVVYPGVKGLFVYPTKALEADQARRLFEYLVAFNEGRQYPLSIGVLDGDTPWNREQLVQLEARGEVRSPFAECPCGGVVRFTRGANNQDIAAPECTKCAKGFPWLRMDRAAIRERWPHLLLTVPDMLHRQLSDQFSWMVHAMFGRQVHLCPGCQAYTPSTHRTLEGARTCKSCGQAFAAPISVCPSLVVFDEAHLYKGFFGSQVGLLISRVKALVQKYGARPVFVGASATIAAPEDFGRQLFGGDVHVVAGLERIDRQLEPSRYHLFVMPVQVTVLNAVGHVLAGCFRADRQHAEVNRTLVFSDSKRTVYQLEASLPEFYATLDESFLGDGINSAPTRSHTGDHSPEERRQVEIAFDRGGLRVLLATQTLEVGVDFRNLQLELQTGATYSYNDYIQRVGRAGRRGVPALVICILRPQVPLDYYYFEHCRELVNFTPETLDEIPLRTDNPFLVERHVPAAVQDYLISAEAGARLVWDRGRAGQVLVQDREGVKGYLEGFFLRPHSWDQDLIRAAIAAGIDRCAAALNARGAEGNTVERLAPLIELSIRATDVGVIVDSDDFQSHRNISVAGRLGAEEEEVDEPQGEDAVEEA